MRRLRNALVYLLLLLDSERAAMAVCGLVEHPRSDFWVPKP